MQSPNPAIVGAAIVEGLDANQPTAHHQDADDDQAVLDEADLREEERAEFYGDAAPVTTPAETSPRRSWLDRLLRR